MNKFVPDIFEREADEKTDTWYRVVRDREDFIGVKKYLNNLWYFFHKNNLYDPHFCIEFPERLFNRWWEMEVAWFLNQRGWSLKSNPAGPDFICTKERDQIYVEAVMCEPGDPNSENYPEELMPGPHREGEFKVTSVDLHERERLELLRLRNSIENKSSQYLKHINKGLIDSAKPYVIALSSAMIPNMISDSDGIPSVVKSVYPVGQIYLSFKKNSVKASDGGRTYRPSIKKHSSVDISTNIFLPPFDNTKYSNISGILYSGYSFKISRDLSKMGDTFYYVHNYIATNTIKLSSFGKNMDYWIEEDNDGYSLKNNMIA